MKRIIGLVSFSLLPVNNWIRVMLYQLRKHLPDEVIVVVNQNTTDETDLKIIEKYATIVLSPTEKWGWYSGQVLYGPLSHGGGLDRLVEWSKQNGIDLLVYTDPDCYMCGRKWFDDLIKSFNEDVWVSGWPGWYNMMSGSPSAWLVSKVKYSFEAQAKTKKEKSHEKYAAIKSKIDPMADHTSAWYDISWDSMMKNWFHAHMEDKVKILQPADDFYHFGVGRTEDPIGFCSPDIKQRNWNSYPLTKKWLEEYQNCSCSLLQLD